METPDPSYSAEPIDLRLVFGEACADAGVAIAFEMPDRVLVLVVDAVSGMARIAEDEFVELPPVFGFARQFFDAACRSAVEGVRPLRLRRQPMLPDGAGLSDPL
jgi:chemotaxis signal transduction protein